jgi:hypothetical protein
LSIPPIDTLNEIFVTHHAKGPQVRKKLLFGRANPVLPLAVTDPLAPVL